MFRVQGCRKFLCFPGFAHQRLAMNVIVGIVRGLLSCMISFFRFVSRRGIWSAAVVVVVVVVSVVVVALVVVGVEVVVVVVVVVVAAAAVVVVVVTMR